MNVAFFFMDLRLLFFECLSEQIISERWRVSPLARQLHCGRSGIDLMMVNFKAVYIYDFVFVPCSEKLFACDESRRENCDEIWLQANWQTEFGFEYNQVRTLCGKKVSKLRSFIEVSKY